MPNFENLDQYEGPANKAGKRPIIPIAPHSQPAGNYRPHPSARASRDANEGLPETNDEVAIEPISVRQMEKEFKQASREADRRRGKNGLRGILVKIKAWWKSLKKNKAKAAKKGKGGHRRGPGSEKGQRDRRKPQQQAGNKNKRRPQRQGEAEGTQAKGDNRSRNRDRSRKRRPRDKDASGAKPQTDKSGNAPDAQRRRAPKKQAQPAGQHQAPKRESQPTPEKAAAPKPAEAAAKPSRKRRKPRPPKDPQARPVNRPGNHLEN
jgi:hypothetical protein